MRDRTGVEVVMDADEGYVIDVAGLPLRELLSSDDSVLANALRRLAREVDDAGEIFAGFQSHRS